MVKKSGCPVRYRSRFESDRRYNRIPSETSWSPLAKKFNIGVLDLDSFADDMGYCDFDDLEISINPKSLYRRDPKKFSRSLRRNSLKGEKIFNRSNREVGVMSKKRWLPSRFS